MTTEPLTPEAEAFWASLQQPDWARDLAQQEPENAVRLCDFCYATATRRFEMTVACDFHEFKLFTNHTTHTGATQ